MAIMTWAKSWQTPLRERRTSSTVVSIEVLPVL
jgi:hypothetical protein